MTAQRRLESSLTALNNPELLNRLSLDLEGESAQTILEWAATTLSPRVTFGTGFGLEGCVLIDLIARHDLAIDIFTLDTGLFFRETYQLWSDLEKRYGVVIRGVRSELSVEDQSRELGDKLWEHQSAKCCEIRKVIPLQKELKTFSGWVSAIRRDQSPTRAGAPILSYDERFDLVKVNPLVAWTKEDVWSYARKNDVPFNPLHLQGYPSIGCLPCTSEVRPGEDDRAGRWRGSNKTECGIHAAPKKQKALPVLNRQVSEGGS
ncbi:MAG: phosphoadenylyl-sulfate reductase [Deltaproteobacteria bacterium]|jgi:phosphoadenosine phosphosulfate reductase|nr:phosphoadenylyl-sulfate reductase [Deltaproteobacteria bacterium]MBT6432630.1 phosphoadenylyl-sulfate reductase [Deltaproteobacteria bacterium]MBT6490689.1 phosphoadenylyl-sulfate reductase [Deltaproteobacteria bacterium]